MNRQITITRSERPAAVRDPYDRRDDPKTRLNLIRLRTHRLIAQKIDADRSLLEIPQRNLDRWRERLQGEDLPAWAEWRTLLKQPWEKIRALIVADTEESTRLRLSTPFAGILTPEERLQFHMADGHTTQDKDGFWHVIGKFRCPDISFASVAPPGKPRSISRVLDALPTIVYNTAALEGNPMTLPEVQTLLDGTAVGGHRDSDIEQVLNQASSWKRLLDMVSEDRFKLDAKTACELQGLVARNEALERGSFRTGDVSISRTDYKPPFAPDLPVLFDAGTITLSQIPCPFTRAMATYLMVARQQFFWDGNKRTGRLLMNGALLSEGHDAICVPAKRQQEFNEKMLAFYDTADAEPMLMFLASCSLDRNLRRVEPERKRSNVR